MNFTAEEKLLISRAEDVVRLSERHYSVKHTGFLTPTETEIIRRNMPAGDVKREFFGGYDGAERMLFAAIPEYCAEEEILQEISLLEISGRDIASLSHRDYLGSILGLGIKREKIGDILVFEDRSMVFVLEDIADYIIQNLEKVGRKGIKIKKIKIEDAEIPPPRIEKIVSTVASLRLDCIVAAALRTSRSKALDHIQSGKVQVNWMEQENSAFSLKAGDVFSIRGIGKFRLSKDITETKKGRLGICIEKML